MSERLKRLSLRNLGITACAISNELTGLEDVGLAVMSPIDRLARQFTEGEDPWSMTRGAEIAEGRARVRGRRSTALRGSLLEENLELLFNDLCREDEALGHLMQHVAKQNPSELLIARIAGVVRALRCVRGTGIPVGCTWERRIALLAGGWLQEAPGTSCRLVV